VSKAGPAKTPIAERLRYVRSQQGISQKNLGILAGIDEFSASARINQYEQGKHVPDYSTAKRLADSLNIPVTYLYTDDDELAEVIRLFAGSSKRQRAKIKRFIVSTDE